MSKKTDAELSKIYEEYFTVVYRYLLSLSHNSHLAEDETTPLSGCIENIYFVDPEYVKDAYDLWNYADDPEKAAEKTSELASHCTLLWSVH